MVEVKAIETNNIVTPHEYIDDDNNVVLAMHAARDENEKVFVVFKNNKYEMRILPKETFLDKYDYCLSEVTISVRPEGIKRIFDEETEVHRDEEFDAFQAFQNAAKEEIGEVEI